MNTVETSKQFKALRLPTREQIQAATTEHLSNSDIFQSYYEGAKQVFPSEDEQIIRIITILFTRLITFGDLVWKSLPIELTHKEDVTILWSGNPLTTSASCTLIITKEGQVVDLLNLKEEEFGLLKLDKIIISINISKLHAIAKRIIRNKEKYLLNSELSETEIVRILETRFIRELHILEEVVVHEIGHALYFQQIIKNPRKMKIFIEHYKSLDQMKAGQSIDEIFRTNPFFKDYYNSTFIERQAIRWQKWYLRETIPDEGAKTRESTPLLLGNLEFTLPNKEEMGIVSIRAQNDQQQVSEYEKELHYLVPTLSNHEEKVFYAQIVSGGFSISQHFLDALPESVKANPEGVHIDFRLANINADISLLSQLDTNTDTYYDLSQVPHDELSQIKLKKLLVLFDPNQGYLQRLRYLYRNRTKHIRDASNSDEKQRALALYQESIYLETFRVACSLVGITGRALSYCQAARKPELWFKLQQEVVRAEKNQALGDRRSNRWKRFFLQNYPTEDVLNSFNLY